MPDSASRSGERPINSTTEAGFQPSTMILDHDYRTNAPRSPPLPLPSGSLTLPTLVTAQEHLHRRVRLIQPTWRNMPHKDQLAILAASRVVDFVQMAALQTVMVHQLKSFDPTLPDHLISHQAGVLQGAFTAAQILTSILWGRAADQPSIGRKMVLQIGLVGTGIGCIGVGFSTSYHQAVIWRLLTGAVNGTVGSARTMLAERTPKPWHSRAFLLLPAAFNVANVLGPILAGMLANPVENLPGLFGVGGVFGTQDWLRIYPFALANLLSTVLLFGEALLVHYGLKETLPGKRTLRFAELSPVRLWRLVQHQTWLVRNQGLRALRHSQRGGLLTDHQSAEMDRTSRSRAKSGPRPTQRLPFSQIWTANVLWTLLSIAIFDFHMGAFANLWILFLATPRECLTDLSPPHSSFKFASGLAFPPQTISFTLAIIGLIGVALQFLLYPWATTRFGLMRCFRFSLLLFPLAYALAPYLALLPSATLSPSPASGLPLWLAITAVLVVQVAARTFAMPAAIILLNNSSPHPSVLATIHGLGQACSAACRTLGPILAGSWYGIWYERGVVGMAWWLTAAVAATGCVAAWWVRNGSGHEIFLPGEEEEEEEEIDMEGGTVASGNRLRK